IESVRGVASGSVVKTLLDRRLIAESGKRQTAGRPSLYSTTRDFLHYFGLNDLTELPQLDDDPVLTPSPFQVGPGIPELPASPIVVDPASAVISAPRG